MLKSHFFAGALILSAVSGVPLAVSNNIKVAETIAKVSELADIGADVNT